MSEVGLPKKELGFAIELMELVDGGAEARTFEFARGGDVSHALAIPLKVDPGIKVVSTLGSGGRHAFLTVTDGDAKEVARVLVDIELREVEVGGFAHGAVLRLEHGFLRAHGRQGVVLLRPSVSFVLSGVPDMLVGVHCFLVVFLGGDDFDVFAAKGLDGLLDLFEAQQRDLISISSLSSGAS